jgi:hypothetical protein
MSWTTQSFEETSISLSLRQVDTSELHVSERETEARNLAILVPHSGCRVEGVLSLA